MVNNFSFEIEFENKKYKSIIKTNKKSKYIRLKITEDLIFVFTINYLISMNDIKYFLQVYKTAISERLNKIQNATFFNPLNNVISLLGKEHKLEIVSTKNNNKYEIGYKNITLYLRSDEDKEKVIRKILKKEAEKYIIPRAYELAKKNNFEVNEIKIKWMIGCWGNCRKLSKKILFSSKLIAYPKEVIDYVIFHELCHLIEANHSSNFWNLVSHFCPWYKSAKKVLKSF